MAGTDATPRRRAPALIAIAAAVIAADQLAKNLVVALLPPEGLRLLPVFNLAHVWNPGVSFGLFNDGGHRGAYALTAFSLALCLLLALWIRRTAHFPLACAIAAVIGGALGNVIDRVRFGAVVDFLDFHIGAWHYPAFNVADSAIVLGIAFILFDGLFWEPKRKESADHASVSPSPDQPV
jgi:signal peptidase II